MERASGELAFERAAQIARPDRRGQARAGASLRAGRERGHGRDRLRDRHGIACVSVLFFRNGISLGSRDFFPRLPMDAERGDVLGSFIAQYYLDRPVPRELIVSHAPADCEPLAEALSAAQPATRSRSSPACAAIARGSSIWRERNARGLARRRGWPAGRRCARASKRCAICSSWTTRRSASNASTSATRWARRRSPRAWCSGRKGRRNRSTAASTSPASRRATTTPRCARRSSGATGASQAGEGKLPDILLIDGGKGQVQQALDVLRELGITGVAVVGVAKGEARRAGEETLILGATGRTLWPGPESPALHLIQAVRDEAHRFAITGHRGRREKAREARAWRRSPGVGAHGARRCCRHFGGLSGLQKAGSRGTHARQGNQ